MGNGSGLSLLAVNTDNVRKMMEDMGENCALIVELAFANGHAKAGLEAMRDGWCSQNGAAAVDEAVTLFENITKKTVTSYRTMVFKLVDFSEKILNATESDDRVYPNYRYDESTKVDYQVVGLLKWNGSNLISSVKFEEAIEKFEKFNKMVAENFDRMVDTVAKNAELAFVPEGVTDHSALNEVNRFVEAMRNEARNNSSEITSSVSEVVAKLKLKLQEKEQDVLDAISYGNQIYPGN